MRKRAIVIIYSADNCIDTITEYSTMTEAMEQIGRDLMFVPGTQIQLFIPQEFKTEVSY